MFFILIKRNLKYVNMKLIYIGKNRILTDYSPWTLLCRGFNKWIVGIGIRAKVETPIHDNIRELVT